MMSLETLKNTYAQEQGYDDWVKMRKATASVSHFDKDWTEICVRSQKAALEKAAENAIAIYDGDYLADVNKESITNPENLIR